MLRSSFTYWNYTQDNSLLTDDTWLSAVEVILGTITHQQQSTQEDGPVPTYYFGRSGSVYPNPKAPANRTGLSKCGFRPSDDETGWPFLISANAMAAVQLSNLALMASTGTGSRLAAIAANATALSIQLRASIEALAPQNKAGAGTIYVSNQCTRRAVVICIPCARLLPGPLFALFACGL